MSELIELSKFVSENDEELMDKNLNIPVKIIKKKIIQDYRKRNGIDEYSSDDPFFVECTENIKNNLIEGTLIKVAMVSGTDDGHYFEYTEYTIKTKDKTFDFQQSLYYFLRQNLGGAKRKRRKTTKRRKNKRKHRKTR
jgi:hypothetical protein